MKPFGPLLLLASLLAASASPCRAGETIYSPDGRFSWKIGAASVTVHPRKRRGRTIRAKLPPKSGKDTRRRVLFPDRGEYFVVLDETIEQFGLHLDIDRGAKDAKMLVVGTLLRLMTSNGRIMYKKRLRDMHFGGKLTGRYAPQVAADGTMAVLLQDGDPYTKVKPLVLAFDRRGRTKLKIDYTSFSRIDEYVLSDDGKQLAVLGLGRLPREETWGPALAHYDVSGKLNWVRSVDRSDDGDRMLMTMRADGWACCVREGAEFAAYSRSGDRARMDGEEMKARFGVDP